MIEGFRKKCVLDDRLFFNVVLTTLSCLGLWVIWGVRFPAMQDYPQHLFMAHVLSSFEHAKFDWSSFYQLNFQFGPYSLFYLVVGLLSKVVGIESAGKVFTSIPLLLTSLLIYRRNSRNRKQSSWFLLLLIPLFFSQIYHMGFLNYLVSIPILFFALEVLQSFEAGGSRLTLAAYAATLSLLFLAHPYTVLVYIVLTVILSIFFAPDSRWKGLFSALIALLLFSAWYGQGFQGATMLPARDLQVVWWPPDDVMMYLFLPMLDMNPTTLKSYICLSAWSVVGCLLIASMANKVNDCCLNGALRSLLAASLAGFFCMPFWLGDYAYFNVRMAPVGYILFFFIYAKYGLSKLTKLFFVPLVLLLMFLTVQKNFNISKQLGLLTPVIERMESNATLLPIYYEATPDELDSKYFYQFLTHSHFYYHIVKGGGASPGLFDSTMNPIRLADGFVFPEFESQPTFYRYILTYGQSPEPAVYHSTHHLSVESGKWSLYERN